MKPRSQSPAAPDSPPPRRPRRARRLVLAVLGVVIALAAGVLLLLPALVSTPPGTRLLVRSINSAMPGRLDIDAIRLRWGSGQTLAGLAFADAGGQHRVRIDRIDAPGVAIARLLRGERDLGDITVVNPQVRIEPSPAPARPPGVGPARPGPVARPKPPAGEELALELPRGLKGRLEVTGGEITFAAADGAPVELTGLDLALDAADPARRVSLEVQARLRQADLTGSFTGNAEATGLVAPTGKIQPKAAVISAAFRLTDLPAAAVDRMLDQEGRLAALVGPLISGQGELRGRLDDLAIALEVDSDNLKARATGKVDPASIQLAGGTRLDATVSPAAWDGFVNPGPASGGARLEEPFRLTAAIEEARVPLTDGRIRAAELALRGSLAIGDVRVRSPRDESRLALRETRLEVASSRLGREAQIQLHTKGERNDKAGTLDVAGTVRDLLDDSGAVDPARVSGSFTGKASELPLQVADELLGTDELLVASLGPTLDMEARAELASDAAAGGAVAGTLSLEARSAHLDLRMSGTVDANRLELGPEGGEVNLAVQPAAAALWLERFRPEAEATVTPQASPPRSLALSAPARLQVVVHRFSLPLSSAPETAGEAPSGRRADLGALRLEAAVTCPELALERGAAQGWLDLRDVAVAVRTEAAGQAVTLEARAGVMPPPAPGGTPAGPGRIEARLQIEGLLAETGGPQPEQARWQIDGRAAALPVAPLDALLGTQGELLALLGPSSSLAFTGSLGGAAAPVEIVLDSPRTTGRIAAAAGEELTLREPAWVHATVSPELAGSLLKRVNPLLVDAVSSREPVRLTVRAQDFAIPLTSPGLAGVRAEARLELGTLTLRSGGLLSTLLEGLRRERTDRIEAVFSPIDLRLQEGVLAYDEASLTVDNLVLETRGRVDLVNDRVELATGVSGQTLAKAFHELRDVIEPDAVVEIPLRGTIDRPQLDTAALASELARLGAQAAIRKNLSGVEGEAASAVLDILLGGPKPAPSPGPGSTQQAPQPADSPLNQILDILQKRKESKP